MPYSLVSAATLGFDLVRLPAGRQVAEVLLAGLTADAGALRLLAGAAPRVTGAERAVRDRRARELAAAGVPQLRTLPAAGLERVAGLLTQLETGTIGSAPGLERLVRSDVLGPEHPALAQVGEEVAVRAADVLADAAVAGWATHVLPAAARLELWEPFATAASLYRRPSPDLGPATPQLQTALALVATLDGPGRDGWRAAVDAVRGERRGWATAMHEACWAAHVSGRTRALAAAQLCAVQAVADARFTVADGAAGVWNALSGCVQGLAMADLLDEGSLALLVAPWEHATGESLLAL